MRTTAAPKGFRPLVTGLGFLVLLGAGSGLASAHPAPYPHRHDTRRAPIQPEEGDHQRRPVEEPVPELGVYLGLGGVVAILVSDPHDEMTQILAPGGGASLMVGFRLNRYAAIAFGWMTTVHRKGPGATDFDTGLLSALTADVKLFLLPWVHRVEPYVDLGLGLYLLGRDGFKTDPLTGPGVQAGVGVDFHLNPVVSIGSELLYRGAFLDNSDNRFEGVPNERAFLSAFTLDANIKLHF